MNLQEQIDAAWDKVRPWSKPTSPPSMEFVDGFLAGMKAGEAAEREACAKACEAELRAEDSRDMDCANGNFNIGVNECVAAIRARSNVELTGAEGVRVE